MSEEEAVKTNKEKDPKRRVKFPFGIKLVVIVTVILLGAAWTITALMAAMVSAELGKTAEDNNAVLNARAAAGAEDRLYRVRADALFLLDLAAAAGDDAPLIRQTETVFFERRQDIAAVIVPGGLSFINRLYFKNNEVDAGGLVSWLGRETESVRRAAAGEPVLRNAASALGVPLLALFYPWREQGVEKSFVIFFSPESLAAIFGSGANAAVMINSDGDVLVHPDIGRILSGANMAEDPLVQALWTADTDTVKLLYSDGDARFYGAGRKLSIPGASVLSVAEYGAVTGSVAAATRRNILLSVTVMFVAILITWFFSRTITAHIKRLMKAAEKIEIGEFELDLKAKSWDEMGVLTERFVHMGRGLMEWEKVKNLVGRFHSQEITGRARQGELVLTGELRQVVVLYADFHSFAEISAKGTPEEALTLLNRYLSKMADSVEKTGGIVDRFIGTRMIAAWGLPLPGKDLAENAMNSIRSALMMRAAMWELNSTRGGPDKPLLRISCGIHAGEVLAGSLGSPRFLEYSLTGKAVDGAVFTEGRCVPNAVDIAVSEEVWNLIGDKILSEELPPAEEGQGGEGWDFRIFGLVNLRALKAREKQRWPFTLDDVRESLKSGAPDSDNDSDSGETQGGVPDLNG
ncbi:MAG: adenylate/guanylate cyclase domain-containing protein [Treponema sp.]|nr:adenylate/guanylate cyclase domain-containing protein [Treponema sp.]